jgi:hypothetical protein
LWCRTNGLPKSTKYIIRRGGFHPSLPMVIVVAIGSP